MLGLMQNRPLLISSLVDYASTWHGQREIVSRDPQGAFHRSNYAEVAARAKRVANALDALGLGRGDRVATLAWNSHRHLELYYGVTSSGRVLHTVNPRLFPDQIQYIMHHAEDAVVCFDPVFAALIEELKPRLPLVRGWVALCEPKAAPAIKGLQPLCYEELMAEASPDYEWPLFDENTASTLCYTSGTTGNPKGVMYSHRSTVLHAFAACAADGLALTARDSFLVIVPLFHANAWSLPFSAAMCGAKMVLPGPKLDPESIYLLLEQEECTKAGGIPTIWLNFLAWVEANRQRLDLGKLKLKHVVSGGAAPPRATIEKFHDLMGVFLQHAWGMTETSPIATTGSPLAKHDAATPSELVDMQVKQGRQVYGIRAQARRPRRARRAARRPIGRRAQGARQLGDLRLFQGRGRSGGRRGRMARNGRCRHDRRGRLRPTHRSPQGRHQVGRRVDLLDRDREPRRVAPGCFRSRGHRRCASRLAGAAVADRPSARRAEADQGVDPRIPRGKLPKWQVPDDIVFVDALPHTATGKLLKTELRQRFHGHLAVSA